MRCEVSCSYTACGAKVARCVLDTWVTDTDARLYGDPSSSKGLKNAKKIKKEKYLARQAACFVPLVYSVDTMTSKEVKSFERHILSLLAKKWDHPYSEMAGYVPRRMGIAVILHNKVLLHGSRYKYQEVPGIEDATG